MKIFVVSTGDHQEFFSSKNEAEKFKQMFKDEIWSDDEIFELDNPRIVPITGYNCFNVVVDKDKNIYCIDNLACTIVNTEACQNIHATIISTIYAPQKQKGNFVTSESGFLSLYVYTKDKETAKIFSLRCVEKLLSLNLWPDKVSLSYLLDEKPEWIECRRKELIPLMY